MAQLTYPLGQQATSPVVQYPQSQVSPNPTVVTHTHRAEEIVEGMFNRERLPVGTVMVGEVRQYAGVTAPDGWLECQGQEVSRSVYGDLFGVIGTSYGVGDGVSTFNLPHPMRFEAGMMIIKV